MNIFKDSTSSIPKSDSQIVRVDMSNSDIGGRKDHMPKDSKADKLAIRHVPSMGKE